MKTCTEMVGLATKKHVRTGLEIHVDNHGSIAVNIKVNYVLVWH